MNIESVFKKGEADQLCQNISSGKNITEYCYKFLLYSLIGSALYGFSMGLYNSPLQAFVSSIKVFILFVCTLVICLPTLHFSGLLFGSRIHFSQTLCVLLSGTALSCIFLGAFAPISLFFLASGATYEFLMIIHVSIFTCCGLAGLLSVKRNMDSLLRVHQEGKSLSPIPSEPGKGPSGAPPEFASQLLRVWFLLYMFIGAQMSYILSPFVGRDEQFVLFASGKGDFFSYMLKIITDLLEPGGGLG